MINRSFPFLLIILLFASACSRRPSWVISEKDMEDLLFDIHLTEAEIDDNSTLQNTKQKEKLLNSVFSKHQITREQFDTSLVWYAAHLDEYVKIYDRLVNRYDILNDTLNKRLKLHNEIEFKAKCLWKQDSSITLRPFVTENKYVFCLDTSSFFFPGDVYELKFSVLGVNKAYKPKVHFSAETQDTTLVKRDLILDNGVFSLLLEVPDAPYRKAYRLSGSIRIPEAATATQLYINDLRINKYKKGFQEITP